MRKEPPRSAPTARSTMPAATATALPPLLPPGVRVTSQGWVAMVRQAEGARQKGVSESRLRASVARQSSGVRAYVVGRAEGLVEGLVWGGGASTRGWASGGGALRVSWRLRRAGGE